MSDEPVLMRVPETDVSIGIEPGTLRLIEEQRWSLLIERAVASERELLGRYREDGIALEAGRSWSEPFAEAASPL